MAKKGDRIVITMACPDCRRRNYSTYKNKRNDQDRMELNKYCPTCRHHTAHKETK
ncbi:MAG: 50S ribosomal protein L33 [Chloroflexi bacterium]|nr:50S ribosomal protein L33 [Chloroflexota bacterium]